MYITISSEHASSSVSHLFPVLCLGVKKQNLIPPFISLLPRETHVTLILPMKAREMGCVCSVTQWCLTICDPMDGSPPGSSALSPGKNTEMALHFPLQGIIPIQGSNSWVFCLSHVVRWVLYPCATLEAQICIYIQLIQSAAQQKLANIVKHYAPLQN